MRSVAESLRILSLTPGRVRFHLRGWTAGDGEQIENLLRQAGGVESVRANPLTGNILIHFDRRTTDAKTLREQLREAWDGRRGAPSCVPPVQGRGRSASAWVRVGVRGLLGHAVVDALWFTAGFLGQAAGLPLAGLGPLHVLMDVAVWVAALRSGTSPPHTLAVRESGDWSSGAAEPCCRP